MHAKIAVANLEEAVKSSIDDLIHNWKSLLKKGGYSNVLFALKSLPENQIQKAKDYLIDLIQHPQKINSVPNVVHLTLSETLSLSDSVSVKRIKGRTNVKNSRA